MWKLLGAVLTSITVALAFKHDNLTVEDVANVLRYNTFPDVSEECLNDLIKYLSGIAKEPWALQMVDSITKFPDGVLIGHFVIPGHFDECVNAVADTFTGKHCMASVKLSLEEETKYHSVLQNFLQKQKRDMVLLFSYGICIPSTCKGREIQNLVESVEELKGLMEVNISEEECSTSGLRPFRTEDWVTVGIIIVFCLLAVGSTCYDLIQRFEMKNEKPSQLLTAFSIYSNGKQIFRISRSSSQLKCLHGIRFLSMTWVILAHAYASFLMGGAPVNMADMPKFMKDKSFVPVSNGFVSVDSFFFLSGLLVCFVFFRDIAKKGSFDVPVAFIHRYMRLTPPFAMLMLIQGTIMSRLGNGPFWNTSFDAIETDCRESWWTGILYVQNYVLPNATCLGQSWYLSADMQMYWVSPLVLYPLLLLPTLAPYFLLVLVLAAALADFAIAFVNDFSPNLFFGMFTIGNPDMNSLPDQFKLEYEPFHTRMAPWLIGVATGYIICGLQAQKIRLNLSKFWTVTGWAAAGALLGGSLFGIIRFISSEYTTAEASLYLAFHRVGWALGLSWVVIACVSGHGGIINDFLGLDIFQPLAKLSYCNFLVHMTLQLYKISSSRTNLYLRHVDIVYGYFGDLLLSNLVSIPVILLFEFPFANLDRHFFQKLVIFPFPKPEREHLKEKSKETAEHSKDVEQGKGQVNPSFVES